MNKRIWFQFFSCICLLLVFAIPKATLAQSNAIQQKVDFMIICAHPGDEYLYLGGVLPLYAGELGRTCVVVYLSSEDSIQREAAINSLSRFGNTVKYEFGEFSSVYTCTKEEGLLYWDERMVTTYIVRLIRMYQPTVVISHDLLGEYGDGAHCIAAECALKAVEYSASDNRYYESLTEFGTWQVQRLFLHRFGSEQEQVVIKRDQPLSRFNNMKALELDQEGYKYYPENYPIAITDEPGYTCANFGLAFSVDESNFDSSSGDLLYGLDSSQLSQPSTPYITQEPTPEIKQIVTPIPEVIENSNAKDEIKVNAKTQTTIDFVLIFCIICVTTSFLCFLLAKERGDIKKFALAVFTLFSLISIVIGCRIIPDKIATLDFEKATSSYTPIPTTKPTSNISTGPTPTQNPWDSYFRSEKEPSEVVIYDPENEHWEYRSDILSVIIDRVHTSRSDGAPICYCVAHIRMRSENSFFAGLHAEDVEAPLELESPCKLARRYHAILAITGDNLTRSEEELKGILIRNGKVYSYNQAQDVLAFYPEQLSMKIFKPNTITPDELIEQGVLNTFSFGPTLLNNGVRDLSSKRTHLGRANPRCGVGMVEPGYFIAITVDGRQADHSVGMTLDGFAQLFYFYGCKTAYNLDGGSSTAMIFMGENLNQHRGEGSDVQRSWTDALLCGKSQLVPSVDDPLYYDGNGPWIPSMLF